MIRLPVALFSVALLVSAAACGKSDCEKAVDKLIECEKDPERQKEIKGMRAMAVAACEEAAKDPEKSKQLECAKKDSCEAIEECELSLRAEDDVKEVNEAVAAGKHKEALTDCTIRIEQYTKVPAFKEACDKAIPAIYKAIGEEFEALYACKEAEAVAAIAPLKKECEGLLGRLQKKIETQRDAGEETDYSTCSNFEELTSALAADKKDAAVLLCKEAKAAKDAKEALTEAAAAVTAKNTMIPYRCKSFLEQKAELASSEWFKSKATEVAKACYGDLGKVVLADVKSFCGMSAKEVHAAAAEYKLGEGDAELAALLEKTAKKCAE